MYKEKTEDNLHQFNVVGKNVIRQDGFAKVTGQAKFADDYKFHGMLNGVMVRLPVAHAKLRSIEYPGLLNNPSITTICDAEDIPGAKKVGPIKQDQPVFAFDKIVTPGDAVAMLVGKDEKMLRKLTSMVKVDYEKLDVLSDPLKALDENSPLIHPESESNLIIHYPLRKGDIEKGFSESDFILEETYSTPHIEHSYLEPECVTAIPLEANNGIKIIGSVQNLYTTRRIVASALNLPLAKVIIIQAELGGSFGGKDDTMNIISARAAVAALKTGRPVKIKYTREESILESYKRHPYIMHYKIGCKLDGKIYAMKVDIVADGGAYASMSPFVTWRSVVQATGPYEIPNVQTDVKAVYTNNPYTGAMRGFGSPQIIFAQESLMDDLAIKLGITPAEVRKINGYKNNSITASGQKLVNHDVNLLEVLDKVIAKSNFTEKWNKNKTLNEEKSSKSILKEKKKIDDKLVITDKEFIEPGNLIRKGIGLALSFRGCSLGAEGIDTAAAYISLEQDGKAYLLCGLAENGQGLRTTYSIIASEILGIPVEDIIYMEQNTSLIPDSGPTVASRATLMGGGAVKSAVKQVRNRLEELLTEEWELPKGSKFVFENKKVHIKNVSEKEIEFCDIVSLAYKKGINLAALGWYKGPHVDWDEETGQGPAYFTYVYGCQVAEVSVNMGTGEVYVDEVYAVHDPGRVINKLGAEGQVYGGVTQGAGYGLFEEINVQEGFIKELNFDQYLIPTIMDIGNINVEFIEGNETYGPWGAKSLGEPTLELTAAAIANAVKNATGIRFFNLPLNLEEVLLKRKLHPDDLKRGST
jgi:CO/xanthine dehydrogenase Mo-binding subunit